MLESSKQPYKAEFGGTPEAGKTTTINTAANILRNAGYKVIVLKESAEDLPPEIAKGTFQANMWMHEGRIWRIWEDILKMFKTGLIYNPYGNARRGN